MSWARRFFLAFFVTLSGMQPLHADDVVLPPTIPNQTPAAESVTNGLLMPPVYANAKHPNQRNIGRRMAPVLFVH